MDNLNFLYKLNINGKVKKSMNGNVCQKVNGDKSTFGSSQNCQNMSKKGQEEKNIFCTLNKVQLPTHLM